MQRGWDFLLAHSALQLRRIAIACVLTAACVASSGTAIAASTDDGKIPDEQLFSYLGKDPLPAGTIPWYCCAR